MRLAELAAGGTSVPFDDIGKDRTLAADVQGQLAVAGILDPPPDGQFGPASQWALQAFLKAAKLPAAAGLTGEGAGLLAGPAAEGVFPAGTGTDLAGRIVAAMLRRGYFLSRHPDCVNIVYVEGMGPDGTVNANAPNEFNDARFLIGVNAAKKWSILGAWEATTEPGRAYTTKPENPLGAARIAFSQRKAWIVGIHKAGRPSAHEALVQVGEITVYRDLNKDFKRTGDKTDTNDNFHVNQHWGFDYPKNDIRDAGAGCLVGRLKDGHRTFMAQVKKDARFGVNKAYRFMTAVMPAAALTETFFDPSTPH